MSTTPRTADMLASLIAVARGAITADIQTECCPVTAPGDHSGQLWWDTRPMVDEREHAHQIVTMARQAIELGAAMQFLHRHPTHQHLVRIITEDTPCP
jgi:hypothetical protein